MALLPYLDEKDASPEVLKALKSGRVVLNIQKMTANAQSIFLQRSRLSNALFTQIVIDPKLREIAILRTAKDCHSVYEWTQHVPAAKHVGVTSEQIAAIENWQSAGCFSEVERTGIAVHRRGERQRQGKPSNRRSPEAPSQPRRNNRIAGDNRSLAPDREYPRNYGSRTRGFRRQSRHSRRDAAAQIDPNRQAKYLIREVQL